MAWLGLVGCTPKKPGPLLPTATSSPPANPFVFTNAQPKLPAMKLWLGSQEIVAELATTPVAVATGMMFRRQMAENEGMLFVFRQPHRASFYMRNTYLPLSCAYIGTDGAILEIHDMKPLDETPIEASTDQVQFVLEVKQGWFERNKVSVGAVVRTERGTLMDTFFGQR
jgi:uncharacterized protein